MVRVVSTSSLPIDLAAQIPDARVEVPAEWRGLAGLELHVTEDRATNSRMKRALSQACDERPASERSGPLGAFVPWW